MKQILQNLKSGTIELAEVPVAYLKEGHILIATRASLISAGTERMLTEFGSASLIGKARQQPERVRQVVDKVRNDGLMPTIDAVRSKLDQPIPLGYSNVGTIVEAKDIGHRAPALEVGDLAVSNAPHAETQPSESGC